MTSTTQISTDGSSSSKGGKSYVIESDRSEGCERKMKVSNYKEEEKGKGKREKKKEEEKKFFQEKV